MNINLADIGVCGAQNTAISCFGGIWWENNIFCVDFNAKTFVHLWNWKIGIRTMQSAIETVEFIQASFILYKCVEAMVHVIFEYLG